jgi:signal transduction histidine kinase
VLSSIGRRVLGGCLTWIAGSTAVTVLVERGNGTATGNLREPTDLVFLVFLLAPAVGGALMLSRTRLTVSAWLLVASTTLACSGLLCHALAVAAALDGREPWYLVWPALWTIGSGLGLLCLVPGRVRNADRRPTIEPLAVGVLVTVALAQAFGPRPLTGVGASLGEIPNPAGVARLEGVVDVVNDLAPPLLAAYALLGLAGLAWDGVRRGAGEGVPLPWTVLALALVPGLVVGAIVAAASGSDSFAAAWWVGVLAPVLVLAGTSVLVTRSWLRERRTTTALRRSVEVREQERERVRADLHDGIGPSLAGMRLQLDTLRDSLADPAAAGAAVDRLEATLQDTLEELRRIVDGLQPGALATHGLPGALRGIAAAMTGPAREDQASIELDVDADLPPLPAEVETVLLRVCAEAVSNAVRHSRSSRCRIVMGLEDGSARLVVLDDGIGMGGHDLGRGHGLRTMRSRVEQLGGTFEVTRRTDGPGTTVSAVIPVPEGS